MSDVSHSLDSAKLTAASMARTQVERLQAVTSAEMLSNSYFEAEGCWVFFLNEQYDGLKLSERLMFTAFAVAKRGEETAYVYDYRPNEEQMQSYVDLWSLHALGKNEEARAAFEIFMKSALRVGEA